MPSTITEQQPLARDGMPRKAATLKPLQVGRWTSPTCRGWFLKKMARTYRVSVRELARRMDVTQVRVREIFAANYSIPYGVACDYLISITGNEKLFSPVVAGTARKRPDYEASYQRCFPSTAKNARN